MNDTLEPYLPSATNWKFHNPVKLTVGRGCRQSLVEELTGKSVLIVTTERGRRQISEDKLLSDLASRCDITWVDRITENPGLTDLQAEIDQLQDGEFDAVLAFGGGSAMDAAKALRIALAGECREHSLKTLLEQPELHRNAKTVPLYTVPTTAGTGSEVTPFATVWHHEIKKKLSLSGPSVFPTEAYVDSALTDSVPPEVTISTGLDAINQAAESVWNKNANSITLAYATRALRLAFAALPLLAKGEGSEEERDRMSEASLLAGLAISHTRTALCHSMSYPITAHFGVPHGLACAFTMPAVLRLNLQAEDGRFRELALALTGTESLDRLVE
ncbi:MAG: phosphonoacetaldehyde reductase [Pseudomonadales bacterium]